MKRFLCILTLAAALLLSACGTASTSEPPVVAFPEGDHVIAARIVGLWEDTVLLAGLKPPYAGVYATEPQALVDAGVAESELKAGEQVWISFDGSIEESQPAKLGAIETAVIPDDGFDGLCGMYLEALDLLWEKDPALHDGIAQIGFDLASTRLTGSEQEALALTFAQSHGGLPVVLGTRQELIDRGLIDGEDLYWTDGVLLSLTEKESGEEEVLFDAEIWRSGLGAYYLYDCTSRQVAGGDWTLFQIGSEAVS